MLNAHCASAAGDEKVLDGWLYESDGLRWVNYCVGFCQQQQKRSVWYSGTCVFNCDPFNEKGEKRWLFNMHIHHENGKVSSAAIC